PSTRRRLCRQNHGAMKMVLNVGACLQAIRTTREDDAGLIACKQAPAFNRIATLLVLLTLPVWSAESANPIIVENQKTGTQDWVLAKVDTVIEATDPKNQDQPHFVRSKK